MCGWQMGKLVTFMSIVVSTVLICLPFISPPGFWCDSLLDKDVMLEPLTSVIKIAAFLAVS